MMAQISQMEENVPLEPAPTLLQIRFLVMLPHTMQCMLCSQAENTMIGKYQEIAHFVT